MNNRKVYIKGKSMAYHYITANGESYSDEIQVQTLMKDLFAIISNVRQDKFVIRILHDEMGGFSK